MSTTNRPKTPDDNVQVWDGRKYAIVKRKTAAQLVRQGTHQLTENLQAKELLTAAQMDAQAAAMAPEPDPTPPKKRRGRPPKKKYQTTEMKAD